MELIFNGFMFLVLLVFFIDSTKIDEVTVSTDKIGAAGFPQFIIIISAILLIYISIKKVREMKKGKTSEKQEYKDIGYKRMFLTIVLLGLYIFIMNIIGYILSTFIFSVLASYTMGYRDMKKVVIFSLILTVAITLIFGKVFFVALPRGISIFREVSYLIY